MPDRTLSESFQISGHFHLPENPDRAIAGTLYYTPKQTELHLANAFQPLLGTVSAGDPVVAYPLIYGVTEKGEAVTLFNAQRLGVSFNFGSGGLRQPERVITTLMVCGAHIPAGFVYSKMGFRIAGLQIWLARPNIDYTFDRRLQDETWTIGYRIERPPKETIRVGVIDADFEWHIGVNWSTEVFTRIDAKIGASVVIRPATPQPVEWFFEQITKLTAMLAMLAGTPMSPDYIMGFDDEDHAFDVLVALTDVQYCEYKNLHEFFLTRGTMGASLEEVLNRWFTIYPTVHMPSRLAMSIFASEGIRLHMEFLSLMQALEGLHRGLCGGKYMDEAEYENVRKTIEASIPSNVQPPHRAALKAKLQYGNEVSLRKRLDALASMLPGPLAASILGEARKVTQQWIDTRNYYTHWDEALRGNLLEGQEMYHSNVRMHHFLRVLYLILMEIPEEVLIRTIGGSSSISQHLIQINAYEKRRADPTAATPVIMSITPQAGGTGDGAPPTEAGSKK